MYKHPSASLKLIEKTYKIRLKLTKLNSSINSSSYKIFHGEKEYDLKEDNALSISFLKDKISAR